MNRVRDNDKLDLGELHNEVIRMSAVLRDLVDENIRLRKIVEGKIEDEDVEKDVTYLRLVFTRDSE